MRFKIECFSYAKKIKTVIRGVLRNNCSKGFRKVFRKTSATNCSFIKLPAVSGNRLCIKDFSLGVFWKLSGQLFIQIAKMPATERGKLSRDRILVSYPYSICYISNLLQMPHWKLHRRQNMFGKKLAKQSEIESVKFVSN